MCHLLSVSYTHLNGVGSVLSFLPIIVTLFFFLSLLEDSGYMARVAFVMDKLLRKIGLSGRSIVPTVSYTHLICLVLGALGIANMWIAIFADVGVMVLAVLNAIRTLFVKNL